MVHFMLQEYFTVTWKCHIRWETLFPYRNRYLFFSTRERNSYFCREIVSLSACARHWPAVHSNGSLLSSHNWQLHDC